MKNPLRFSLSITPISGIKHEPFSSLYPLENILIHLQQTKAVQYAEMPFTKDHECFIF